MSLPTKVKLVEVGPRDGLQNEAQNVPVEVKVKLVEMLVGAGLTSIEPGAFVSPKWVPQMAASAEVYARVTKSPGISLPMLVPNMRGLEQAIESGVEEIALFAAATETFSQKNTNCSIGQSIERFEQVAERAQSESMRIRGYISCAMGCPYEGEVSIDKVVELTKRLHEIGCYEISVADTIGVGTASNAWKLFEKLANVVPVNQLAGHFHDTYGQALANIYAVLQCGVAVIDSSVAGLGGCPYAKGATGNVATEDVVYMLDGMGIETGVDMPKLLEAGVYINSFLERESVSRAANALLKKKAG
jgi:hydroxymethylglutaryl-CoA lyase